VAAVLLYCYHYDLETGKYGAMVANILRLAAAATILLLGGLLFILWRLDRSVTRKKTTVTATKTGSTKTGYAQ
jgi:hypothetical protein